MARSELGTLEKVDCGACPRAAAAILWPWPCSSAWPSGRCTRTRRPARCASARSTRASGSTTARSTPWSPSLEKRKLIAPQETERKGRLPERTVYRLTDAGRIELHDWLTELLSTPVKDYTSFEAALSFLPTLPPEDVASLLRERAEHLEREIAQAHASRELAEKQHVPRLFWVEEEFRTVLREAELGYVRALASQIAEGTLGGDDWWKAIHEPEDDGPEDDGPEVGR